ncbi:hypothetical protein CVT26_012825 [Gymnopilus dilepis]|uniref:C3H1-type domain-containing protein n=1 Tax=Gymnopilus dilepis TaxID=231916 RepID=A0A409Y451_9AGAR|nr:hypothetical protein CVT26_012825 [Gymnopilus dilepis]
MSEDAHTTRSSQVARSAVQQSIDFVPSGPTGTPNTGDQSITPDTASGTTTQRSGDPRTSADTITGTDPTQEVERCVILNKLETIVDRLRRREIPKARAIINISSVLAESDFLTHAEEESTLNSYLAEIDACAQNFGDEVGAKGKERAEKELFGDHNRERGGGDQRGGRDGTGGGSREMGRKSSSGGAALGDVRKRGEDDDGLERFSHVSVHEYGESSSEEEGEGSRRKRVRLTEEEMPWFSDSHSNRSPSCKRTCELLKLYERDYGRAKFFVKTAPDAPPGFPVSQWDKIFRGEPIDLNQRERLAWETRKSALEWLNQHGKLNPNQIGYPRGTLPFEPTGSLSPTEITSSAPTEITFKGSSPPKMNQCIPPSSTLTVSAWNFAVRAYRLAFPHRDNELRAYGDYIQGIFASKDESVHPSIIHFDIGVRNHVGGGQTILLTDTHQFFSLYNALVMSDGVAFQSRLNSSRRARGRSQPSSSKGDVCNRFNVGICPNSDNDCRYQHICRNCRQRGHGRNQCPANK